jgi:fructose-1,6-bisphosphatase-3
MRIKALQPFESVQKVLMENKDIESDSTTFETEDKRILVGDTDIGKKIKEDISDLKRLLAAYRRGDIKPN